MTRILHVADLHANQAWLKWVSDNARRFDVVCIAGDLLDGFSDIGVVQQARTLQSWLLSLPVPTVVCSGNHDWWDRDRRMPDDAFAEGGWLRALSAQRNVICPDGSVAQIGGLQFAAVSWGSREFWSTNTDVAVHHEPLRGSTREVSDRTLGQGSGLEFVSALVERPPRLCLCGHVHNPPQHWFWLSGGSRQTLLLMPGFSVDRSEPNRWEIDTGLGEARRFGSESELVSFPAF